MSDIGQLIKRCAECGGNGYHLGARFSQSACPRCDGKGQVAHHPESSVANATGSPDDEGGEFRPDWVSPPGATIRAVIDEKGWTLQYAANRLGMTHSQMLCLIEGTLPIGPQFTGWLANVLGSTPEFWGRREAQYREALATGRRPVEPPPSADSIEHALQQPKSIYSTPEVYRKDLIWCFDCGAAVTDCKHSSSRGGGA